MDWDLCVVCQKETKESLSCPQSTTKYNPIDVYKDFISNVQEFLELDALPVNVSFIEFDYVGQAETFMAHKASWHRSCHQKFNSSKLERERKKKRKRDELENEKKDDKVPRPKRRSSDSSVCIFCAELTQEKLHEFSTLGTDESLKQMATEMQDTEILSKIMSGDLIAIKAKYHLACLVKYRNKYRSFLREHNRSENDDSERNRARVFAELVAYIENSLEDGIYFYKLSDLHNRYEQRLKELNDDISIHKTRLKEKLLDYFSDMGLQQQTDGRNKILVFPEGMQQMMKDAFHDRDYENEGILFSKVAKIIRRELLSVNTFFNGCFEPGCQNTLTPLTNLLVSMLMYGTDIHGNVEFSQACLTVSQLLLFHCKNKDKGQTATHRHSLKREPPYHST